MARRRGADSGRGLDARRAGDACPGRALDVRLAPREPCSSTRASRSSSATSAAGSTRPTSAGDRDRVRGAPRGRARPRRDRRAVRLRLPRTGLHGRRALGLGRLRRARRSRARATRSRASFPSRTARGSRSSPRRSTSLRGNRVRALDDTPPLTPTSSSTRRTGSSTRVVAEQESLPGGSRDAVVREALDGYINQTYRSLRYGTRLDAVEAIPYALRTIFALENRVRPYNKYLEWELRHHPLEGWAADELLPLLDRRAHGRARGPARALQAHRGARAPCGLRRRHRRLGAGRRAGSAASGGYRDR